MKLHRIYSIALLVLAALALVWLASCAPAMSPTVPSPTHAPEVTGPQPTSTPMSAPATPPPVQETATPGGVIQPTLETPAFPTSEARLVELEWPAHMRLGNSDIVRVSLIPSATGYTVKAEFPEHPTQTQDVNVPRPPGYDLYAIGRLEGASFDIAPQGEQPFRLDPGETITWRWSLTPHSSGTHRLALSLLLRWTPQEGASLSPRESLIFSRALQVDVGSILGLTENQALITGILVALVILAIIGGLLLMNRRSGKPLDLVRPNPDVVLEPLSGSPLPPDAQDLLRALFARYARVVVTAEFRSGYSGSRTWLVIPVHADGRRDAQTIVKLGPASLIQAEFYNYETFVKDTLPPITARIQQPPVGLPRHTREGRQTVRPAALRYTFIGQSGQAPTSLRQALLSDPNPAYLSRLFDTFGPNWWMQRRPATFRLGEEYDERLPAHLVLEPIQPAGSGVPVLDGRQPPAGLAVKPGDVVAIRHFYRCELRADGISYALEGKAAPGQPPLRIRWVLPAQPKSLPPESSGSLRPPVEGSYGRVIATRRNLLAEAVAGMDRFGLPDPLDCLPAWLDETISGSQSVIHGDLNLENILVGPGGLVWLIDFARTRLGHPLADFAHLEAEIIAQVLSVQEPSPEAFLHSLQSSSSPLLTALETIASRCLANPSQPREYHLALAVTSLGMLKYTNLTASARHYLYLTGAWLGMER